MPMSFLLNYQRLLGVQPHQGVEISWTDLCREKLDRVQVRGKKTSSMATGQGRRRPCPLLAVGMCRQRPVLCLSAVTSVIPAASGLSVRMLATLNAACHSRRDLIKQSSWALGMPAQGAHTNQSEERVLTRKQPPLQHPPSWRGGGTWVWGGFLPLYGGTPGPYHWHSLSCSN